MNLFLVFVLAGAIIYELYSGGIPVRRKRAISRSERPLQYWFWIIAQAVFIMVLLLGWLGVINFTL